MSNAIAVWAYPDSNTVTGTIRVGVVAYHSTGIDRVVFSVDDGATTTVTAMTQNPDSLDWNGEQEYEYVYTIDTTALSDASHTVQATAYPETGTEIALPDRTIQVWNSGSPSSWYVDGTLGNDTTGNGSTGSPWATLTKACNEVTGGDTVYVRNGTYELPDDAGYGFTKFVTFQPDTGHSVTITAAVGAQTIRSSYFKFVDITFLTTVAEVPFISAPNEGCSHLWWDQCVLTGYGRAEAANDDAVLRLADTEHVTLTNCTGSDGGNTLTFGGSISDYKGHLIVRGCDCDHNTADFMEYNGYVCLITGNRYYGTTKPGGAFQHGDHIQSNMSARQVVIRNNLLYAGRDQGNKFGGFDSTGHGFDGAVNQIYYDVALVSNVYALAANEAVNLHFETNYKEFNNILIENNTFYGGSTTFEIHASCPATDVIVRNNIFYGGGADAQGPATGFTFTTNHHTTSGDPLFTDVSGGDFTIGALSPCRSAGTAGASTRDIRSYDRHPTTPDLGAYEYQDYDAVPDYTTMIVLGIRS